MSTLAPVAETRHAHRVTRKGGRVSSRKVGTGYTTTDGAWHFAQQEPGVPGSPWEVWHVQDAPGVPCTCYRWPVSVRPSSRSCREFAGSGEADAALARKIAAWLSLAAEAEAGKRTWQSVAEACAAEG